MRTAALFAIAVLFASAVRAAAPNPADWYTPEDFKDSDTKEGTWDYNGDPVDVKIKEDGTVTKSDGSAIDPPETQEDKILFDMYKNALQGAFLAERNKKRIETLGQNLNDLLMFKGFEISDFSGGKYKVYIGDGTQSIKDYLGAKGNVPAVSTQKIADGLTLNWRIDGSGDKETRALQLMSANNVATAAGEQEFLTPDARCYVPMVYDTPSDANNYIRYFKFGGIDQTVLEAYQFENVTGKSLTLKNWQDSESREGISMSRLLTEADGNAATMRRTRDILVRTTENGPGSAVVDLAYIPIGDVLTGLGNPPDGVSIEDYVDGSSTNLAIKGWHADVRYLKPLSALITRPDDASASPGDPEVVVVAKCVYGNGSNELAYVELGSLYGVTWATNWTEAVEHITKEETIKIVNVVTNIVNHEDFVTNMIYHEEFVTNTFNNVNWITNFYDVFETITNYHEYFTFQTNMFNHEEFITNVYERTEFISNVFENVEMITNWYEIVNSVTNYHEFFTFMTNMYYHEDFVTNWFDVVESITNYHEFFSFETNAYEKLHYIENWTHVTNYIIRYLGGGSSEGGGGGGGEGGGATLDPKDDPYSPEYEKDEYSDIFLPVRNALMIVAITNKPMEKIRGENMFDWDVINTNVDQLVQLRGFRNADASETAKVPVKRKADDITMPAGEAPYNLDYHTDYALDWMDYPEDLMKITSGDIKKIVAWLNSHTSETNILAVVATNAEILAAMATNLFSHVKAETLLDNKTIWTNSAQKIEIKGYETAEPYATPYIDWGKVTNRVDRGYWDYEITPEEVIDPVSGETNTVWHTNKTWIADWQTEVTEDKVFKWLRMPIPDVDGMLQYETPYNYSIEGHTIYEPDDNTKAHRLASIYGFNAAGDCAIPYKHDPTEEEEYFYSNQISRVMWTTKPEDASPTKNYELTMNGSRVAWTPSASAIRFVGNVGSDGIVNEAVVGEGANTNTVTFASAADSNVKVDVQGDGDGNVTITIGVYYLNNASVQPPNVE